MPCLTDYEYCVMNYIKWTQTVCFISTNWAMFLKQYLYEEYFDHSYFRLQYENIWLRVVASIIICIQL